MGRDRNRFGTRARNVTNVVTPEPEIVVQDDLGALDAQIRGLQERRDAIVAQQRDIAQKAAQNEQEQERYRLCFWPKGEALPKELVKPKSGLVPCPKCYRIRTDTLSVSSVVQSSGREVAFLRCAICGHRWKLPVRYVNPVLRPYVPEEPDPELD
jgi:DNA-directed RNA polymerase subunit M/transcription elongation factor TFIIS